MSLNKQITLNEVANAITKQWKIAILTFLVLMTCVAIVFLLMPRKYGSEGRLFVQLGRNGTGMDPTPGKTSISIQDSRETEIRSVSELVKSRAIIEAVVARIGPDEILDSPLSFLNFGISLPKFSWGSNSDDAMAKAEYERLKQFELAAKAIEKAMTVHTEKKTSVISVYCKANSPALAQKIVKMLMEETQAKHLEVHSIKGSTEFFTDNFSKKQKELVKAEQALRDFRNENNFLSIGGAIATQQNIINKLELELIDSEANFKQSTRRLDEIRQQSAGIDPTVKVPRTGIEKLSTEDSRTELFKLESEYRQLEKRYSEDHPRLAQLKASLDSLQSELDEMPTARIESETQVNPVYEKVKVSLVNAIAEANAHQSRWDNLKQKHTEAIEKLRTLNAKEIEASQLQRDLNIVRQAMDIYIRKRTEASVIDELDQKRISDVVVAQKANFVVKHVSPRGSILIPLGAFFSGLCAVLAALYFERDLLSGHLSEDEVEQILEVPILVTLPKVKTQRNMVI